MKKATLIIFCIGIIASCSKGEYASSGQVSTGGSLARMAITGDRLFAVYNNTVHEFNISQNGLVKKQNLTVSNEIETIFARDAKTLFLGSPTGMAIIDIANNKLEPLSFYPHFFACDPVVANDSLAFVTLNSGFQNSNVCFNAENMLMTFDIRNLKEIVLLGQKELNKPIGLSLRNDVLFVCNGDGLDAYSFTNPANPTLITRIELPGALDVIATHRSIIVTGTQGITQLQYTDSTFTILSTL